MIPPLVIACLLLALLSGCATTPHPPPRLDRLEHWIDLLAAEAVSESAVLDDLATADVVYLGESHSAQRHHTLQLRLLQGLLTRRPALVLCFEQLEAPDQPAIDRYNRREIDFDTLAREIDWAKKWTNYPDYRALCEFARAHRIPLRALNAPATVIRAINRGGGLASLPADQRALLPPDIVLEDPAYERALASAFAAHKSMDASRLRPMFEAQVARDEAMAANIVAARLADGAPRLAVVILGAGHARHGLGTPARVRRRDASLVDRIVLATSDDADPSPHAGLRALERPSADYLRVLPRMPAGHPTVRP